MSELPPEELCEGDPDLEDEHAALEMGDPATVNAALEAAGRIMGTANGLPGDRLETGPIRFGKDWPGVFLRGKHALFFGLQLEVMLDALVALGKDKQPIGTIFTEKILRGLVSDLKSCAVEGGLTEIETLKPIEQCRKPNG